MVLSHKFLFKIKCWISNIGLVFKKTWIQKKPRHYILVLLKWVMLIILHFRFNSNILWVLLSGSQVHILGLATSEMSLKLRPSLHSPSLTTTTYLVILVVFWFEWLKLPKPDDNFKRHSYCPLVIFFIEPLFKMYGTL